jgi:carbamoyltransferase
MTAVLGVSGLYHDSAAALAVDGEIVCAVQEERLSRVKNDASLPRRAASACLRHAGMNAGDLDRVVFYENPFLRVERVLTSLLRHFPRAWRQFPRAIGAQLGSKLWALDSLADHLDVDRKKVTFADHHRCHAASAFFGSGLSRAAVITVDGVGEDVATAIWRAEGTTLTCVRAIEFPHSLGLFYAALTAYLGFEVNEGEYKVMGLAAFGKPRFRDEMKKLITLHADGTYELDLDYFAFTTDTDLGFSRRMEKLFGPRRPPNKPWHLDASEDDRRCADIAATLQAVLEDAMLGLAREAIHATGISDLCVAGGVALNAVANARLLSESGCQRVFVHPAAGDAGGAFGAALLGSVELGVTPRATLTTAALGLSAVASDAREVASGLGLIATAIDGPNAVQVSDLLEQDKIVAFVGGRFEWGPRALGQRSILARTEDGAVVERINRKIKQREPFRPFAPAVLAEDAATYFDGAPNDMTPFMTSVCRVRDEQKDKLAAVTHVDGTARVQTVTPASAPSLSAILLEMKRRGHLPVLLNTSLNGKGEPLCASAEDAVAFIAAHAVDALVVEDVLITREKE